MSAAYILGVTLNTVWTNLNIKPCFFCACKIILPSTFFFLFLKNDFSLKIQDNTEAKKATLTIGPWPGTQTQTRVNKKNFTQHLESWQLWKILTWLILLAVICIPLLLRKKKKKKMKFPWKFLPRKKVGTSEFGPGAGARPAVWVMETAASNWLRKESDYWKGKR